MRRSLLALLLILGTTAAVVVSSSLPHGYAQAAGPFSDEFNNNTFTAPFTVTCAPLASPACPTGGDPQGASTWSLNGVQPGNLRIITQRGNLVGATNDARNLVLQTFSSASDWKVTTKLTFPATTTGINGLGQTAGLLVYQDMDNFIYLARVYTQVNGVTGSQIEFRQEIGGIDTANQVTEPGIPQPTVYLQVRKSGNQYTGWYCYTNCEASDASYVAVAPGTPATATPLPTNTPVGTATSVPVATATTVPTPTAYTGNYSQVGVFAYGGSNTAVATSQLAADFDWFRVGNQATPAPTAQPTSTGTVSATNTPVPATSTSTAVPATSTPTAAPTNTPTNTPVPPTPTPTPKPKPTVVKAQFQYISIWWHAVREGTYQHVQVQAKNHSIHGIWALVYLPSGQHYYYYENTDASGLWVKEFPIPRNAISRYSHDAVITFQLWKGKSTVKNFGSFILVR